MFHHSTNTALFLSVLIATLIFSLSLAGIAAAQDNTSLGTGALFSNTTGEDNSASGLNALFNNTTGTDNTAIGAGADVSGGDLTNATAIGAAARVDASDKIRLGNGAVTVIG
jgi:hypothetical protein